MGERGDVEGEAGGCVHHESEGGRVYRLRVYIYHVTTVELPRKPNVAMAT